MWKTSEDPVDIISPSQSRWSLPERLGFGVGLGTQGPGLGTLGFHNGSRTGVTALPK